MKFLIFGMIAVAGAIPDPARMFAPEQPFAPAMGRMPVGAGGRAAVAAAAREQGAMMIEQYLKNADSLCLARAMCQYGARKQSKTLDLANTTIADAWAFVLETMNNAWESIKEHYENLVGGNGGDEVVETSSLKQILGAVQVGEAMGYETCRTLFQCSEDFFTVQKGRTTCEGNAKVCPGFAIGCSLCSLYNPVACGPTCTVAAFYCGFGAYACAAEADAEAEAATANPTMAVG